MPVKRRVGSKDRRQRRLSPALSPDGMRMASIRGYPGTFTDRPNTKVNVRQHPDRFAFAGMSRSPDGMSIAVGSGSDSWLTILQVMVGDGTRRELTGWQWLDVRGLAWENEGDEIILSARLTGHPRAQIWRLPVLYVDPGRFESDLAD